MLQYENRGKENWSKKGGALKEAPSTYVTIAIDTTGFDIEVDQITEISAVRFKHGKEIAYYTKKIKKINDNENNVLALADKKEQDLKGVLNELLSFIKEDVLIGYQVDFIIRFLSAYTDKLIGRTIINSYVDTAYLVRSQVVNTMNCYPVYYNDNKYHTLVECYIANEILRNAKRRNLRSQDQLEYTIQSTLVRVKRKIEKLERVDMRREYRAKCDKQGDDWNNMEHSLLGKECVFTGKLNRMLRGDAKQIIYQQGGINSNAVTNHTDYLILGGKTYEGNSMMRSTKYRKAERLYKEGSGIKIISEEEFFRCVSKDTV